MTNGENAVLDPRALIGITTLVTGTHAPPARSAPATSRDRNRRTRTSYGATARVAGPTPDGFDSAQVTA